MRPVVPARKPSACRPKSARARAAHQTNDTNGGRSSIDKSCKTWENGGTHDGPQPGQINWKPDASRGLGGAHTSIRTER